MRSLTAAPKELAFGSFQGALPRIAWAGASAGTRILRGKKWLYVAIASDDVWVSLAVLRTGYAANILAYVFDRRERRLLVDKTILAPGPTAHVSDDVHAGGVIARYKLGNGEVLIERSGPDLEVRAHLARIELDATLDESTGPAGIVAAADLGGGVRTATEKRALARVRGKLAVGGITYDLTHAVGGWDYSNGLMPRHTKWRWAFGLGPEIGFNLVEGFVGEAECALFKPSGVEPLAEPRFTFDRYAPSQPWRIEGEGIDLRFEVGAVHAQHTNLGLVRSHFLQPVGAFFGTIGGVEVDGVPGVVEDQDVLW